MQNVRVSIMAAITDERGLGKDNDLLVKIPEDFARMKKLTIGHPIIMGRKTYESIGRPLPGRLNIIISRSIDRNVSEKYENCIYVNSLEHAFKLANEWEDDKIKNFQNTKYEILNTDREIFIFGGAQIFQEALPHVDRLYLTVIHKNFPADVFFPDYSEFTKVIEKSDHTFENIPYTFLTLEK